MRMVSLDERRGARREQECLLISSLAITSPTMVLVMVGVSKVVATSNQLIHRFSNRRTSLLFPVLILLPFRSKATRLFLDKMRRDSGWTLGGIVAPNFPST